MPRAKNLIIGFLSIMVLIGFYFCHRQTRKLDYERYVSGELAQAVMFYEEKLFGTDDPDWGDNHLGVWQVTIETTKQRFALPFNQWENRKIHHTPNVKQK